MADQEGSLSQEERTGGEWKRPDHLNVTRTELSRLSVFCILRPRRPATPSPTDLGTSFRILRRARVRHDDDREFIAKTLGTERRMEP